MPLRMTGLVSGLDTETMIKDLMKVQRLRSERVEKNITSLEWKQEKWKGINTKLYSFYTGSLSKMRMEGNFALKKATSSNEDVLEVTAKATAPEGNHSVQVKSLANAQFVTGAKLGLDENSKEITLSTKLADLGFDTTNGSVIKIEAGGKTINFDIGESTTVSNFIDSLKSAGLNASYDTLQKRFFISSKESGVANAYSITNTTSELSLDRNEIRTNLGYSTLTTSQKEAVDNALLAYINPVSTQQDKDAAKATLLTTTHNKVKADYITAYKADPSNITRVTDSERARLEAELDPEETLSETVLQEAVKVKLAEEATTAVNAEYDAWKNNTDVPGNVFQDSETLLNTKLAEYAADAIAEPASTASSNLKLLGLNDIKVQNDGTVTVTGTEQMALIKATDAVVVYNGAELTNSTNTFTANGVTFTAKDETGTSVVNFSVTNDAQAVYNSIKDFIKNYNEVLKELNTAYNADSAKGYEPLTDDEREAMSDKQVEQWEDKIKSALLRKDTKLGSVINSMRSHMADNVEVDGKNYSLSSFGIVTGDYTERGILYIQGDSDSSTVSALDDKLMKAINENPDAVMEVFTQLSGDLYKTMTKQMSSSSLNSALTFYNDKEIKNTLTRYREDLVKLEDKLIDMEDRYYAQFAAMETALEKLNSQSSSLMSMLGQTS